jgi:hypothetical protein
MMTTTLLPHRQQQAPATDVVIKLRFVVVKQGAFRGPLLFLVFASDLLPGVRMRFYLFPLFAFALPLTACSSLGGAVGSAAQVYWNSRNPPSYADTPLQPQFTYLEVRTGNSSALMVLAEVDQPANESRVVETWISGSGEVLRTQSGFVVGSTGVATLPETLLPTWSNMFPNTGGPASSVLNMPSAGISSLPMAWQSAAVPTKTLSKPGQLFQRAQKIPDLKLSAWIARATVATPRTAGYQEAYQLVAVNPATGNLVYGQFCLGALNNSAHGQCIEYLLRNAAANL